MTPENVLDHPALVLDQRARTRYFADGFLTVPGHVGPSWLHRLRAVAAKLCGGSLTPLLTHLLTVESLSPQERQELRAWMEGRCPKPDPD